MKNKIFTIILSAALAVPALPQAAKAWGTDITVNPTTGEVYKNARVTVAYDGTIYVGRLVKKPSSISFQDWEILKSTDNGATFTPFASNFFSGTTKYTNFDLVAAGNNATDFRIFTARTYMDTATSTNDVAFNKIDQSGNVSPVTINETNYINSRGYTGLSLATDSRDKNSNANPYSISLVVSKAGSMDSVVAWTDNVGGTSLVRRSLAGTSGYIRNVGAAIGSADPNNSAYGRLGIVWEDATTFSAAWATVYIQYIYPDDATDPSIYPGAHNINSTTGTCRNPSIALSQNTSASDIYTYVSFEYDGGGTGVDLAARVDDKIINNAPIFSSAPGISSLNGDQVNAYAMYNAATDSFMITFYDDAAKSLVYKRRKDVGITTGNPQIAFANYRDASTSMTGAFPRIDAAAGSRAYTVWNDNGSTMFDGEVIWPTSVQSTSMSVADIMLYPNPATDLVNISFSATDNDKVSISIMDMSGRVLQASEATITRGENVLPVRLQGLPAGNYTIRMNGTHVNTALLFTVTP